MKLLNYFILSIMLSFSLSLNAECGKVVNLKDCKWEFKQVGKNDWLKATVPGTVHQDLINNNLLPNPFYGINEEKIQWVEKEDWEYRTSFSLTKEELEYDDVLLDIEGMDTYADIYLNGAMVKHTDNMFVGYKIPVKDILREGNNNLQVYFHSPITTTLPQLETQGFQYPAGNDHSDQKLSVYTRKAPYSYGWDWGIRMVTSGIWRPISLKFYNKAFISDLYVRQDSICSSLAKLSNVITVNSLTEEEATVSVKCSYKSGKCEKASKQVKLKKGTNEIVLPMNIYNPKLWMPNGWGESALYDFSADVLIDGKEVAEKNDKIGLRKIEVVMQKDNDGMSFFFRVNGHPMFAKGANYIPDDALLPNVTEDRVRRLFADVKAANMNMLRIWGGGVYESDLFYRLADENGIIIWQDFMFACTTYPSDKTFLKRVDEEAEYNIRRLRNHACIGMWCGNNEILEGLKYWGWDEDYSDPSVIKGMYKSYDKLFRELLPGKVNKLDPGKFYMHGSPYCSNWGHPETWKTGDSHNWGVWYGRKPFESFDSEYGRFMSEFGIQSFPEMKTISQFASEKDYQIESEVMNAHQKATIGNELIKCYMESYYRVPESFQDFVYVGMLLQAKGMRHGFEAQRRNKPYCMGTIYWQLNDSWPVVSWSSIDYYENWKALHYDARRAFAPIIINAIKEKDDLNVYVISDKLENIDNAVLELKVMDFKGKVISTSKARGSVKANSSSLFYKENFDIKAKDAANTMLVMILKDSKGNVITRDVYYFNKVKDLNLPLAKIESKIRKADGEYAITMKSNVLAKDVFIEIPTQGVRFSDNFFDLLPGEKKCIILKSDKLKKDDDVKVTIHQLRDTYK